MGISTICLDTFAWRCHHCGQCGITQSICLYDGGRPQNNIKSINPYLVDGPDVLVASCSRPLCDVPEIVTGNQATDDGNFFIAPEEYNDFISRTSEAQKHIKKAYNSQGFING